MCPTMTKTIERGRRYCLYLNYCEEPTDLVAPYSQDDSCAVTCQPSRLREGFTFELRCPSDDPEPPSFIDRLQCCIGDLGEADRKSSDIERSQAYAQRNRLGVAAYKARGAAAIRRRGRGADHRRERDSSPSVAADSRRPAPWPGQAADERPREEQMLRTALDEVHAVGAATARFHLLSPEEARKVLGKHQALDGALKANSGGAGAVSRRRSTSAPPRAWRRRSNAPWRARWWPRA